MAPQLSPPRPAAQAADPSRPALPKTLALVDDDIDYAGYLARFLHDRGVQVRVFGDSNELLADASPYEFDFYVLDLMLPGVDGVELIKVLRRRTGVGIIVVSGRLAPDVFDSVLGAGADMYLAKPARFEQITLAIEAIQRRTAAAREQVSCWRLDRRAAELVAPDGTRVALSEADCAVMQCFLEAQGRPVTRETLTERLGRTAADGPDNVLHATIYRLRRRIERATPAVVPLQSQSRVGYVFRAKLLAA